MLSVQQDQEESQNKIESILSSEVLKLKYKNSEKIAAMPRSENAY